MTTPEQIETSIVKKYKKNIWHRFVKAGREYSLVNDGDRIVCAVFGDIRSLLIAKCYERLHKYSETQFELAFVGSGAEQVKAFGLDVENTDPAEYARAHGFNKLALPDCFDDCIEHTLSTQLYDGRLEALPPCEHSDRLTVIRAGMLIRRDDIAAFARYNGLEELAPLSLAGENGHILKARALISALAKDNKNLEINILRSCEEVNLETVISYIQGGEVKSVLDTF